MPLDPQAAILLESINNSDQPLMESLTPPEARRQYEQGIAVVAGSAPAMHKVSEHEAPGPLGPIPLRVYVPRDPGARALPLLIYLHGGGHVIGSRNTHDVACRHLANHGDCIVVSVDYHLAPEHPFPAPLEDCLAASDWVFAQAEQLGGRADWIAIGGDSAGGNLATEVCLADRGAGRARLIHQLLIYPATDMTCSQPSHQELATGYRLTESLIQWFVGHYLSGQRQDRRDPMCSPLLADDLRGLPPALVISAGYDPLRDENIAYHEKLLAHGVESRHDHYPGMIHGFINMTGFLDEALNCLKACGQQLQQVFYGER